MWQWQSKEMIWALENNFAMRNRHDFVYLSLLFYLFTLFIHSNWGKKKIWTWVHMDLRKVLISGNELMTDEVKKKFQHKAFHFSICLSDSLSIQQKRSEPMRLKLVKDYHDTLKEMAGPSWLEVFEMKASCLLKLSLPICLNFLVQ